MRKMAVYLLALSIGGACLLAVWTQVERADAWVRSTQPFPQGEATVVLHRFCKGRECVSTRPSWPDLIQAALDEWNRAGSNFTFHTRPVRPGDDPCNLPGEVAIISVDPDTLCPGDGPLLDVHGPVGRVEYRLGGARVYIKDRPIPGPPTREDGIALTLLHELGHVVGLDHPDEHGQHVDAVMNTTNYFRRLQPDDIAGIRALYPPQDDGDDDEPTGPPDDEPTGPPTDLESFLENPAPRSFQSGIGVIAGWACEAKRVEIIFNGDDANPHSVGYGTSRADTLDTCGDEENGFGMTFNWNLLGDGQHTVTLRIDGEDITERTVTVTTLGAEFPEGLEGAYVLKDFPHPGASVVVRWEESLQNFVIQGHQ